VCFWNDELFEIEKSAQFLINDLFLSNVLHKNAQSASLFVNKNWNKINKWWFSNKTQKSVLNFVNHYAKNQEKIKNISIKRLKFLDLS
tara:strand:- start:273 stop:536 length:264 start_codon:yes stop_codon:yes gene_type:complete